MWGGLIGFQLGIQLAGDGVVMVKERAEAKGGVRLAPGEQEKAALGGVIEDRWTIVWAGAADGGASGSDVRLHKFNFAKRGHVFAEHHLVCRRRGRVAALANEPRAIHFGLLQDCLLDLGDG